MRRAILFAGIASSIAIGTVASAQTPYQQQQRNYQQALRQNQQQQRDYQHARREWARGQRLPSTYRTRDHIVGDYGERGWRRPPHGYAYYTTDNGDVVMAAVATGVIRSIVLNSADHRRR